MSTADYPFPERTSTDPMESPAPNDRRWRLASEPIPMNLGFVWVAVDEEAWKREDERHCEENYTGPVMLVNTVFATNKFVTHWMPAFMPQMPENCAFEAGIAGLHRLEGDRHAR